MTKLVSLVCLFIGLCCASSMTHALAIASTTVSGSNTRGGCGDGSPSFDTETVTGNGPQTAGARITGASLSGDCGYLAEATADMTGVRVNLDLALTGNGAGGYDTTARYFADDFVYTGGVAGSVQQISANLSFTGLLSAFINPTPTTNPNVAGNLAGFTGGDVTGRVAIGGAGAVSPSSYRFNTSALANAANTADNGTVPGIVVTDVFEIIVGQPFAMTFRLNATVFGGPTRGTRSPFTSVHGGVIGNFNNTLWFARDRAAFNTSGGGRVDSIGAGITNNFVTGTTPGSPPSTDVPEPAAIWLLLPGLALAWMRRRTHRI